MLMLMLRKFVGEKGLLRLSFTSLVVIVVRYGSEREASN